MAPLPFSIEFGVKYTITGPTGVRAVLNDPTDANFVGFLMGDNAVTGLEGATVRDNSATIPEANGRVQARNYLDGLAFTLNGQIVGNDAAQTLARGDRLTRATAARKADAILSWTPTGGVPVQVRFRAQQRTTIQNRRPKNFLVAGIAESSYVEAVDPTNVVIPYNGAASVENRGGGEAWPSLKLKGPMVNPVFKLYTPPAFDPATGFALSDGGFGCVFTVATTIPSTGALTIQTNPRNRSILFDPNPVGSTTTTPGYAPIENWSDRLTWNASRWGPIEGPCDATLTGDSTGGATGSLTLSYRDAWG